MPAALGAFGVASRYHREETMAPKIAVAAAAPPAPAPQDRYETIELPIGMTVEDLLGAPGETDDGAAEPEPEPEPESAPRPVARPPARPVAVAPAPVARPAPVVPAVEPEPAAPRRKSEATRTAVVPLPELLKSRDRVTALSGDNARLRSENHRLRGEAIQRRMLEQAQVDPVTITAQDQEVLAKIAANESDLGKVQVQTAQFLAAKFNAVRATEAARRSVDSEQQRLYDSQRVFRERQRVEKVPKGLDYDSVGRDSGIFAAFEIDPETKTYAEPATVADIKAAQNPAERAYELGLIRLREMGWLAEPEVGAEPEPEPEPEPTPAPAAKARGRQEPPAPAPAAGPRRAPVAEVEAAAREGERRGAAAVVNRADERGRGIRHLPSAGGGPARLQVTAAFLDGLKDRDPDKWLDILKNNPQLEYDYMSGTLT